MARNNNVFRISSKGIGLELNLVVKCSKIVFKYSAANILKLK